MLMSDLDRYMQGPELDVGAARGSLVSAQVTGEVLRRLRSKTMSLIGSGCAPETVPFRISSILLPTSNAIL